MNYAVVPMSDLMKISKIQYPRLPKKIGQYQHTLFKAQKNLLAQWH